jgi:RimJ/RimL family protein N-acetyltransferase
MIESARLILREWRDSDLDGFAAMSADRRVMEFFPSLLDREQSAAQIARWRAHYTEHGFGFLAVEVPGVADFVGLCGMAHVRFNAPFAPAVEIGWRLAYDHWGHGYAAEGAKAMLDYGFTTLDLGEIVAFAVVANQRSRRVMDRIGMTHDPADDFDHPGLPAGHVLRRHVLYRAARDGARRTR